MISLTELELDKPIDIAVVGAGAAGLMAAIAAKSARPGAHVVVFNNNDKVGLKILVSGGGRCNVTNEVVDETDFTTDKPHVLRGLLRAFSAAEAREFFEVRDCEMYAEPLGKLFPVTDKARQVLDVLLDELQRLKIPLVAPAEVESLQPVNEGWTVSITGNDDIRAVKVVLATGGKSLPKTGSRGAGYEMLDCLGHEIVSTLPALTPLLLASNGPLADHAGVTVPVVLTLSPAGTQPEQLSGSRFKPLARAGGSLLVTHKGVSGPAGLDVSGRCARALEDGEDVTLTGDFWSLTEPEGEWSNYLGMDKPPGACLRQDRTPRPPGFDGFMSQAADVFSNREASLARAVMNRLPRGLGESLLLARNLDPSTPVKQLNKPMWLRLHLALTQADLKLSGVDDYNKAEVTTGGLQLSELDRVTLESRRHRGLYVCGEVVNVTGRLGGFNFQWAWSSGHAAGIGATKD